MNTPKQTSDEPENYNHVWLFFRYIDDDCGECWYPVEKHIHHVKTEYQVMMDNITMNPETTKVTDVDGNILWKRELH